MFACFFIPQCCFGLCSPLLSSPLYVYFKNKCKAVNMSVYSTAAVFPDITGIAQSIFLLVQ